MAIQEVVPGFGTVGTDVEIIGDGFLNATGVQFGGVAAPMLVINANLIRASVPPNAQTGKVTVTDPDGNQISPNDFAVRLPTAPENTARGSEAVEQIFLIGNAKTRGDSKTIGRYSDNLVFLKNNDSQVEVLEKPQVGNEPALSQFETTVMGNVPAQFNLEKMKINGDTVICTGVEPGVARYFLQLRRTSAGYRLQIVVNQDL